MDIKNKNKIVLIAGAVVIVILVVALIFFVKQSKQKDVEMTEMVEQMNFEKKEIEKEFTDMNQEFDGYTSNIHNDSLVQLLNNQKTKVQQLLDELRVTKATNARRIAQLKNELATVRKVMILYVNQIDSLNAANHVLRTENVEVKRKFQAVSETVEQLSKEKADMHQVISRAAMLEITNFSMTPLGSNGKKTGWFSRTANLQFNYTIAKNVTSQPGEKTIYLRITRPDDDVLTKGGMFTYEDKKIEYSASKTFEYTGDAKSDVLYWKVDEILPKGKYRADFFVDGNRIGSFSFNFEK